MNRYVVTYYTKTKREIVSAEFVSDLNLKEFIDYIMKRISKDDFFRIDTSINSENRYEILLKGNIEGFEVTQY